jgi:hypothetical protein
MWRDEIYQEGSPWPCPFTIPLYRKRERRPAMSASYPTAGRPSPVFASRQARKQATDGGSGTLAIRSLFAHREPGMETEMNKQVKAVVDGFRHLMDADQTTAYLEIEAIWKTLQDNEQTERPQPAVMAKRMGDDWPR